MPNGQFVRNSESCSAYFYCNNGIAVPAACPSPFVFDPVNQICDQRMYVDCTSCSPFGIQNIEDQNDSRRYFNCIAGVRSHKTCSEGLIFDPKIGDCNLKTVGSFNTMCKKLIRQGPINIGNPSDCKK